MMKSKISVLGTLALGLFCQACTTPETHVEPPADTIESHVDLAFELAGETFMKTTATLQCTKTDLARRMLSKFDGAPPTKLFDNLYFVGKSSVSSWAITTSDGIILIDALNNSDDARDVIEPGLRSFGLDPASIKYVIVAHGHGDHYGGAGYLAETYGARILMTEDDWTLAATPRVGEPPKGMPKPNWSPAPAKDLIAEDGMDVTLGDTTVHIVTTPGHTAGTISLIFPVQENDQSHTVGLWGGTGFPGDLDLVRQYVDSADKFRSISGEKGVDVVLSNHPFVENSGVRMEELRNNPDAGNPFVIGEQAASDYVTILGECAKAEIVRREQAGSSETE